GRLQRARGGVAMADAAGGRVYGTALAEAAEDSGRLHEVARALAAIADAVTQSRDLSRALFNPAFPHAAKKQILAQLSAGSDELARSPVFVLAGDKRP